MLEAQNTISLRKRWIMSWRYFDFILLITETKNDSIKLVEIMTSCTVLLTM